MLYAVESTGQLGRHRDMSGSLTGSRKQIQSVQQPRQSNYGGAATLVCAYAAKLAGAGERLVSLLWRHFTDGGLYNAVWSRGLPDIYDANACIRCTKCALGEFHPYSADWCMRLARCAHAGT